MAKPSVRVVRRDQLSDDTPQTPGLLREVAFDSRNPDAKVLSVDPSYRLLTLQYPNGQAQTFKVGLDVKLLEMEPGDIVVIRTMELIALRVEKP